MPMKKGKSERARFASLNAMLEISLQVPNAAWTDEIGDPGRILAEVVAAVHEACPAARERHSEVCFVLGDDRQVEDLNSRFRGIAKPTNVLSFPAHEDAVAQGTPVSDETPPLGDVVFGFETIIREASEQSKTISNHFSHLAVHGLLHLMGYDHIDEGQAGEMEALEIRILAQLGIANPYEDLAC